MNMKSLLVVFFVLVNIGTAIASEAERLKFATALAKRTLSGYRVGNTSVLFEEGEYRYEGKKVDEYFRKEEVRLLELKDGVYKFQRTNSGKDLETEEWSVVRDIEIRPFSFYVDVSLKWAERGRISTGYIASWDEEKERIVFSKAGVPDEYMDMKGIYTREAFETVLTVLMLPVSEVDLSGRYPPGQNPYPNGLYLHLKDDTHWIEE